MKINKLISTVTAPSAGVSPIGNTLNTEMILIIVLAIIAVILLALVVVLFVKMDKLNKKLRMFMSGKDGASLEDSLQILEEDVFALKEHATRTKREIKNIYKKQESNFQKLGLVKYDAFQQMGGQLSFSLALLDEHNDGFLINSVHSTEGCYSYTKPILGGECELALGKEEQQALDIAKAKK